MTSAIFNSSKPITLNICYFNPPTLSFLCKTFIKESNLPWKISHFSLLSPLMLCSQPFSSPLTVGSIYKIDLTLPHSVTWQLWCESTQARLHVSATRSHTCLSSQVHFFYWHIHTHTHNSRSKGCKHCSFTDHRCKTEKGSRQLKKPGGEENISGIEYGECVGEGLRDSRLESQRGCIYRTLEYIKMVQTLHGGNIANKQNRNKRQYGCAFWK